MIVTMDRKKYKIGTAVMVFFIVILLFSDKAAVYGQDERKINMTVHYGLYDTARYGRIMPVYVQIESGIKDLEGVVFITMANQGNQDNIRYAKNVIVAAGGETVVSFEIDLTTSFTDIQAVFETENGEIQIEQSYTLKMENYGEYAVYGILTNNQEGMCHFEDYGTKIYYLNNNNIPEHYLGMDMLDVILIEQYDTNTLSRQQQEALGLWAENGGTLVLGAGTVLLDYKNDNEVQKTENITFGLDTEPWKVKLLEERIMNYISMRSGAFMNNEVRTKLAKLTAREMYIGKEMMPLEQNEIFTSFEKEIIQVEEPGAEVILRNAGEGVLFRKKVGEGSILLSAISLASEHRMAGKEREQIPAELYFTGFILDQISEKNSRRMESELYGYNTRYYEESIIATADDGNLPSVTKYAAILLCYLLFCAPVPFYLLYRFRMSKYLWGIVPLFALLFTGIIYAAGNSTRITNPYFGFLDVKYVDTEQKEILGKLDFYVALPHNQGYRFMLPDIKTVAVGNQKPDTYYAVDYGEEGSNNLYVGVPVDYGSYSAGFHYTQEAVGIEIGKLPAFQKSYFSASYEIPYYEAVEGFVTISSNSMAGVVKNHLATSLKDAFLISNHLYVPLGELKSNASLEVNETMAVSLVSQDIMYDITYGESGEETSAQLRIRQAKQKALLEALEEGGSYLVGFTDGVDADNPLSTLQLSAPGYGNTMFVIRLQERSGEKGIFVPSMEEYLEVTESGNYGETTLSGLRISVSGDVSERITGVFHLPTEEIIDEIVFSGMLNHLTDLERYTLPGKIYFLNRIKGAYDLVFSWENNMETQVLGKERISEYLGENHELSVMYQEISADKICILPLISYYKKGSEPDA